MSFAIDQMCPMVRTDPQTLKDEEALFFLSPKLLTMPGAQRPPSLVADSRLRAPWSRAL